MVEKQVLDLLQAAVEVSSSVEASYDCQTNRYGKEWFAEAQRVCQEKNLPPVLVELVYFLALSGEGADYCRYVLEGI